MKKIKIPHGIVFLVLLLNLFMTLSCYSYSTGAYYESNKTYRIGLYEYQHNTRENIFITNYLGDETELVIPNKINNFNVSIGNGAFQNKNLTSIIINDGIKIISDNAFANNRLTSITIPSSVTSIGASTFANNQLTSVTIPDNITTIGANAFENNPLTSFIFTGSVDTIVTNSFGTLTPYYWCNDKQSGTYSWNGSIWSYNGIILTKTPAVLRTQSLTGVSLSLSNIDGNDSTKGYSIGGEYWIPAGTHNIKMQYRKSTRTLVSIGDPFNPNDDRYAVTTLEGVAEFEGDFHEGVIYRVSAEETYGVINIVLDRMGQ
jgi:hypothetical protein